jgi:RNA polymerase sigma factor (TIGR02999 family)
VTEPGEITQFLAAARQGDRAAIDAVFQRVYREVRGIAELQMRRAGIVQTLSTTAIVHEAYLRLVKSPNIDWEDRSHFFAVAAKAMRQVLLNHARSHLAQKRGGGRPLSLEDHDAPFEAQVAELVALDRALDRLLELDERLARVVELRYFGGLSVEETARVLGVADRTVKRDWQAARAFLFRELHGEAT